MIAVSAASCGHGGDSKSNESDKEIEAARIAGREAARVFVNRPWQDTIELQKHLLEVRASQSKYVIAGKPQSAAAFDSAFVSTIKTVSPDVARELEAARAQQEADKK